MGDIIVASESAYFLPSLPPHRSGARTAASSLSSLHAEADARKPRAMEMVLLGDKVPAVNALSEGLVNRCVA